MPHHKRRRAADDSEPMRRIKSEPVIRAATLRPNIINLGLEIVPAPAPAPSPALAPVFAPTPAPAPAPQPLVLAHSHEPDLVAVRTLLLWLATKHAVVTDLPFSRGRDIGSGSACTVFEARMPKEGGRGPLRLANGALAVVKWSPLYEQAVYALVPHVVELASLLDELPPSLQRGFLRATATIFGSRGEAKEALRTTRQKRRTVQEVTWFAAAERGNGTAATTTTFVQLTQFWCQTAVASLIDEYVAPHCVHFIQGQRAMLTRDIGGVAGATIMERVHGTLHAVLSRMSADAMRAVTFQFLVALHAAQTRIGFKHHDTHNKNVFIVLLDDAWASSKLKALRHMHDAVWCGARLADDPALAYVLARPDGSLAHFSVPHHGLLVKLGDYDHASAHLPGAPHARFMRADLELLPVFDPDTAAKWGPWNGLLEGHRGYDAQVFVGYMLRQRSRLTAGAIAFLTALQARVGGPTGVTEYGRPAYGAVSDVPPIALLLDDDLFGDFVCTVCAPGTLAYSEAPEPVA